MQPNELSTFFAKELAANARISFPYLYKIREFAALIFLNLRFTTV